MSPKGTSSYSDWSENDNWYYPDNASQLLNQNNLGVHIGDYNPYYCL